MNKWTPEEEARLERFRSDAEHGYFVDTLWVIAKLDEERLARAMAEAEAEEAEEDVESYADALEAERIARSAVDARAARLALIVDTGVEVISACAALSWSGGDGRAYEWEKRAARWLRLARDGGFEGERTVESVTKEPVVERIVRVRR